MENSHLLPKERVTQPRRTEPEEDNRAIVAELEEYPIEVLEAVLVILRARRQHDQS